tara:strand:+ start:3855 stop:4544 length:690 start_codon:yes stop_codon:yes gene_type:complete
MKLSVIIPCYNEEKTIDVILDKVIKNNYTDKEIIVIDDYSTDNSRKIIEKYKENKIFKFIFNQKNRGKGFCIRGGIKIADGDIIIIQDADLEYDPSEHIRVIQPILDGKADVVYGSRFRGYGVSRTIYFWHRIGNFLITNLCNIFTNLNLTDVETCFKAIKLEKIKNIQLKENGFGIEPEITIKLAKNKCRFYEVGISYYGREYSEGKKITWIDGIKAIFYIFRYSFFK